MDERTPNVPPTPEIKPGDALYLSDSEKEKIDRIVEDDQFNRFQALNMTIGPKRAKRYMAVENLKGISVSLEDARVANQAREDAIIKEQSERAQKILEETGTSSTDEQPTEPNTDAQHLMQEAMRIRDELGKNE